MIPSFRDERGDIGLAVVSSEKVRRVVSARKELMACIWKDLLRWNDW